MVPGSTFRYGSHFWRVMRRPRLSSKQPIEAAATPFPREETTPPVTKIYFGPIGKALEFLRWSRRTTHYRWKARACQIANSNGLGRLHRIRPEKRYCAAVPLRDLFENAGNIGGNVHADGIVISFDHADAKAIFKPAKLLELLEAFEFAWRECGIFQQRVTTKSVKPKVFPVLRGDRCPLSRVPRGWEHARNRAHCCQNRRRPSPRSDP